MTSSSHHALRIAVVRIWRGMSIDLKNDTATLNPALDTHRCRTFYKREVRARVRVRARAQARSYFACIELI